MTHPDRRLIEWAGQDLARIATEWDRATSLLEPGRERRWHQHVPTPEQQQAAAEQHRADRAAAFEATRAGVKTLPAAAAPVDLRVVEAMQQAGWAITCLTGELRAHFGAGPLFVHDAIPTTPGQSEADARFKAARAWLARSGLHGVTGDLLEHAAAEIRRALRILTAVTSDQQYTRVIAAACPACRRLSLRAHLDSANARDWLVQCHAQDCRARWEYDQWGDLGGTIGVDVFAAVAGDSAA